MSAAENIFGGVIVVMFFLALLIILNRSTTEYIVTDYIFEKEEHVNDLYSSNFNTILLITENQTGRSMSTLLANTIYYREEVLNFSDKSINVTNEFEELLNDIYGEDRYYLEIKPKIIEVSLNFVIDGSPSLKDEREKLADELPEIIKNVEAKINETGDEIVTADVFILEEKDHEDLLCDIFPNNKYTHINSRACVVIDHDDIYDQIPDDISNIGFDVNSTEYLKYFHNLDTPYDNETLVNGRRIEGGIKAYYGSDWGTGSAYVSILRRSDAKLVLVFPMGDELSTSSISEDCFDVTGSDANTRRAKEKMCDLCTASCSSSSQTETETRSLKTVDKAIEVAGAYGTIINPIFAYNCEYEYKTIFNAQYVWAGLGTSEPANVCEESNCNGCSKISTGVCFHPECKDEITSQMEKLATDTNGRVIDLKDIDELDYDIDDAIRNNLEEFKFTVGEFKNITRYVTSRTIPLPNKIMVDAKLFIFPLNETSRGGLI
jgi:hypothetical protein